MRLETDTPFHAAILRAALTEHGITDVGEMPSKLSPARKIPALTVYSHASTPGMGKCLVDVNARRAKFYGESGDYGLGIDPAHLDSIRRLQPDWTIEFE